MGVPKRRQSKARKNKRRSIWRQIPVPGMAECPQCHAQKLTHHVCPQCGYYKGKEVVKVKEA